MKVETCFRENDQLYIFKASRSLRLDLRAYQLIRATFMRKKNGQLLEEFSARARAGAE